MAAGVAAVCSAAPPPSTAEAVILAARRRKPQSASSSSPLISSSPPWRARRGPAGEEVAAAGGDLQAVARRGRGRAPGGRHAVVSPRRGGGGRRGGRTPAPGEDGGDRWLASLAATSQAEEEAVGEGGYQRPTWRKRSWRREVDRILRLRSELRARRGRRGVGGRLTVSGTPPPRRLRAGSASPSSTPAPSTDARRLCSLPHLLLSCVDLLPRVDAERKLTLEVLGRGRLRPRAPPPPASSSSSALKLLGCLCFLARAPTLGPTWRRGGDSVAAVQCSIWRRKWGARRYRARYRPPLHLVATLYGDCIPYSVHECEEDMTRGDDTAQLHLCHKGILGFVERPWD